MMPLTPRRSVRRCDALGDRCCRIRAPYLTTLWTTRVLLRKRLGNLRRFWLLVAGRRYSLQV